MGVVCIDTQTAACSLGAAVELRSKAWTVEALADLLEVSPKTLYKQIKLGRLAAIRIGSLLRIDPKDAGQWIRNRTTVVSTRAQRAA